MTTIHERVKSKTPRFFRKIRNIGLVLGAVSVGILTAPIALPAVLITAAGYIGLAGTVASAVSQCAKEPE